MCIETAKNGRQVLFLVHRKELLEQTVETFKRLEANLDLIKIGMILTVGNHLEEYNPNLIICDECNFALSKTWRKVLDNFPKAFVVGLSATPVRLSGEPMGDVFDCIIEDITAEELIQRGNLCKYDYYAPKIDFDTSEFKIKMGDFDTNEIQEAMDKPKIYGDILKYFEKYSKNKKAIAYCTSIQHSQKTAEEFIKAGYKAEHIDANTSKKERAEIINRFKNGDTQILCNCDLISFGFDCPDCETVLLLRPTCSVALYIQQSMRCLRGRDNKRAVILDFVGNVFRHGMPTQKREWTLQGKIKCDNRNAEPDIKSRQCNKCYKVYAGINKICPYCGNDNGKTRKEIEQEKQAELEKITEIKKKQKKLEVWKATTLEELKKIEKERGYKSGWAYMRFKIMNQKKRK